MAAAEPAKRDATLVTDTRLYWALMNHPIGSRTILHNTVSRVAATALVKAIAQVNAHMPQALADIVIELADIGPVLRIMMEISPADCQRVDTMAGIITSDFAYFYSLVNTIADSTGRAALLPRHDCLAPMGDIIHAYEVLATTTCTTTFARELYNLIVWTTQPQQKVENAA